MDNRIKQSFDTIHADDILIEKTKTAVFNEMNRREAPHIGRSKIIALAASFVLVFGGLLSYNLPVCAVSVEASQTVDLKVNMYKKVISVKSYGETLSEIPDVKNMEYIDAINSIITYEGSMQTEKECQSVDLTVICGSEAKARKIQNCISKQAEVCPDDVHKCCNEKINQAKGESVPYGKYAAYLELCEVTSEVSFDEVRDMTAKQIRALAREYSAPCDTSTTAPTDEIDIPETQCDKNCENNGEKGHNGGENYGNGNGKGNGNNKDCCN